MNQTGPKEVPDWTWVRGKGDPLGVVQEFRIWAYWQIVCA